MFAARQQRFSACAIAAASILVTSQARADNHSPGRGYSAANTVLTTVRAGPHWPSWGRVARTRRRSQVSWHFIRIQPVRGPELAFVRRAASSLIRRLRFFAGPLAILGTVRDG